MPTEPDRSLPLFAYGTLMFPEVIAEVVGRSPAGQAAEIVGFKNCGVKDRSFPGLLPTGQGTVAGVLYAGLSASEWERLDAFEDDFYLLQEVVVTVDGVERKALAYVVPTENAGVLTQETWDPEVFRRDFLARYLNGTARLFSRTEL